MRPLLRNGVSFASLLAVVIAIVTCAIVGAFLYVQHHISGSYELSPRLFGNHFTRWVVIQAVAATMVLVTGRVARGHTLWVWPQGIAAAIVLGIGVVLVTPLSVMVAFSFLMALFGNG